MPRIPCSDSIVQKYISSSSSYLSPTVIYGHVHMAKTGGTLINGNLSAHYERICGHKGYSYAAFNTNQRFKPPSQEAPYYLGFNRAHVAIGVMNRIDYHDCDWISFEQNWNRWLQFQNWNIPMSPVEDPVDHPMQLQPKDI